MDELLGKIKKKYEIKGETFHALRDAFNVIMMEKQENVDDVGQYSNRPSLSHYQSAKNQSGRLKS